MEISIATVALIVILLYVFRNNIKQLSDAAPKITSSLINPAVRAAIHVDHVVATNCNEAAEELIDRNIAIKERLDAKGIKSFEDMDKLIKFLN